MPICHDRPEADPDSIRSMPKLPPTLIWVRGLFESGMSVRV